MIGTSSDESSQLTISMFPPYLDDDTESRTSSIGNIIHEPIPTTENLMKRVRSCCSDDRMDYCHDQN